MTPETSRWIAKAFNSPVFRNVDFKERMRILKTCALEGTGPGLTKDAEGKRLFAEAEKQIGKKGQAPKDKEKPEDEETAEDEAAETAEEEESEEDEKPYPKGKTPAKRKFSAADDHDSDYYDKSLAVERERLSLLELSVGKSSRGGHPSNYRMRVPPGGARQWDESEHPRDEDGEFTFSDEGDRAGVVGDDTPPAPKKKENPALLKKLSDAMAKTSHINLVAKKVDDSTLEISHGLKGRDVSDVVSMADEFLAKQGWEVARVNWLPKIKNLPIPEQLDSYFGLDPRKDTKKIMQAAASISYYSKRTGESLKVEWKPGESSAKIVAD